MNDKYKLKINKYDMILILTLVYSFFTLTQSLYPFSISRLVIACISLFFVLSEKQKRENIYIYIYIIFVILYTMFFARNISVNINDCVYFSIAILELHFFLKTNAWEELFIAYNRNDKIISMVAILDFFIIMISVLVPSCYIQHWGGEQYLIGFTGSAHAMAASCCLAMTIMMLNLIKKKFNLLNLLILAIYVLVILKTGARIFIVPSILIIFYYIYKKVRKASWRLIIYIIGACGFIFSFLNSSMMKKIIFAIQNPYSKSMLESLSGSRSVFWKVDINAFFEADTSKMLFGHGFDYVYALNLKMVGMEIWAHNDFINILLSIGLVGFFVYVGILSKTMKNISKWNSRFDTLLLLLYFLFPAFFNGFYSYYHFFSSFIVLILITYILSRKSKE